MDIYRRERIREFQMSWAHLFRALCAEVGGLVRMQVDRYFSPPVGSERGTEICRYCSGLAKTSLQSLVAHEHVVRRQHECHACGTVFDGVAIFRSGAIKCSERWRRGATHDVRIGVTTDRALSGNFVAAAVVEPFRKRVDSPAVVIAEGELPETATTFELGFPALTLQSSALTGSHHLNVILIADVHVLFLRREIYVDT